MKLYRGQAYGDPVGCWWTTHIEYARSHTRARHRAWVVLEIDASPDDEKKLRIGPGREIRIDDVATRNFAARIVDGFLPIG